jgi:hypothetical protein
VGCSWPGAICADRGSLPTGDPGSIVSPLRNCLTAGRRNDYYYSGGIFCRQFYGSIETAAVRNDDFVGSVKVEASVRSVDSMTFSSLNVGMMIEIILNPRLS